MNVLKVFSDDDRTTQFVLNWLWLSATERCKGEHEVYNSSASGCPTTCRTCQPRPCILPCKFGCFCKQGYLRNSAGACVEEEYCS